MDNELSNTNSSYERAMIHNECEKKFGISSPKKVISQKESEICRIDRDLEKLLKRTSSVADKSARNIKKLILDGNNLSFQGDTFIGLTALKSFLPTFADEYEVVVVFDASIRRSLRCNNSDIRNSLGSDIQIYAVANSVQADETLLDIAGSDDTTFVVSNDRFAEFGDNKRIIRHEIVSGHVLISDLSLSEEFQ